MSVKTQKNISSTIKITAKDLVKSASLTNVINKSKRKQKKSNIWDSIYPFNDCFYSQNHLINYSFYFICSRLLSDVKIVYLKSWYFHFSLQCKYSNSIFCFSTGICSLPWIRCYTNNNTIWFFKFENDSWKYFCCPIYRWIDEAFLINKETKT